MINSPVLPRIITALLVGLWCSQVHAEQPLDKYVTDEKVAEAIRVALQNVDKAFCGDTKCTAATPEEFASPPISIENGRAAMQAGMASGILQWCGLDWNIRSFAPMMTYHRQIVGMTDRQLALMAILHGMQKALIAKGLASQTCSADQRANIDRQMPGQGH